MTRKKLLESPAVSLLALERVTFDPAREFQVVPLKGKPYLKKLGEMTVKEMLLAGYNSGGRSDLFRSLCRSTRGYGGGKVGEIEDRLVRILVS